MCRGATGYCQESDRGVRQDIAGKRTGVSDRVLPESGPEVSDRILPESGPEVSDRILPESGPRCPTGYCRKADRGVRQGFRQEKVLILAETIPGENPKPVMYSQTPLFKSK